MAGAARKLTDDEGTFLALLLRVQPASAYQLSKIYEASPVSNFGTSKGKIYPMIARLRDAGLLTGKRTARGTRHVEQLTCTRAGETAVRTWLIEIRPEHLLLEDPLRTKIQSFDLLSRMEQIEWLIEAKAQLQKKLDELEAYGETVTVPFQDWVHDNAVSALRSRLDWIDRVLVELGRAKPAQASR